MGIKNEITNKDGVVSRRQALVGAAVAVTGLGVAGSGKAAGGHDAHAGHGYMAPSSAVKAVIDGTAHCQVAGQNCIEHCIQLLKGGDTAMGECLDRAQEMLAMCTATGRMAGFNNAHLKRLVAVCIDVCDDCRKACLKHADKHAECKACAESCKACITACKAYLAA